MLANDSAFVGLDVGANEKRAAKARFLLDGWRWTGSRANPSHRRIAAITEIYREFETSPATCRHRHRAESKSQRGLQAEPVIFSWNRTGN